MLRTQPVTAAPPPVAPGIPVDPVEVLALAMIEQEAQGRAVTRELLLRVTDFTSGEIDRHAAAAQDRAIELRRARETRS